MKYLVEICKNGETVKEVWVDIDGPSLTDASSFFAWANSIGKLPDGYTAGIDFTRPENVS